MAISGNSSCISGQDVRDEVTAGRLEWASSDPGTGVLPANKCLTRTRYNDYIKNDGGLADSSRLVNYGDAIAHADFTAPGPLLTRSISFGGSAQDCRVSGGAGISGTADGDQYSYEGWFKRVGSGAQVLIGRVNGSGDGWFLGIDGSNKYGLYVVSGGTATRYGFGETETMGTGWEHVSMQIDVDTSEDQTCTFVRNASTTKNETVTVAVSDGTLSFGDSHDYNVSGFDPFEGLIACPRVYKVLRSAATIAGDYQSLTEGASCHAEWDLTSYTGTYSFDCSGGVDGDRGDLLCSGATLSSDVPF